MSTWLTSTFFTPNVPIPQDEWYDGTQFRYGRLVFRPREFKTEGLILLGLLAYLAFWQMGRIMNQRRAKAWLDAHRSLLSAQFSKPLNVSGELISDGPCDFYNFSTGRRGITSLNTTFALLPRHDLILTLYNIGRGLIELSFKPRDEILLDFKLPASTSLPNMVWSVVDKDELSEMRAGRFDLQVFTRAGDNPALPKHLSVMTEASTVSDAVLKETPNFSLTRVLKDPLAARYFRSLTISDLPLTEPEEPTSLLQGERHVVLSLRVPPASNAADTVPLVTGIFVFVDFLQSKYFSLQPNVISRLKQERTDLERKLAKSFEKQGVDEALDKKRAAKRKVEEERVARLSAAEQKKYDEKERKRTLRKAQGKMSVRR